MMINVGNLDLTLILLDSMYTYTCILKLLLFLNDMIDYRSNGLKFCCTWLERGLFHMYSVFSNVFPILCASSKKNHVKKDTYIFSNLKLSVAG